jgi:hypothetical protein
MLPMFAVGEVETKSSVCHDSKFGFAAMGGRFWKPDDRLMLYSPRVLGVAWQTRVNDRFIFDDLDDWRMT